MLALVTGANGHLGFNLVRTLLDRGWRVRASVRTMAAARRGPLGALPAVELVEADVRDPQAMRAAMEGIDTLFHAAAVYVLSDPGRAGEIVEVSLRGAETALRAAADARVRKVVLTSSIVTLPLTRPGAPPVDESHWTTDLRVPYIRAKTEAERRAWSLAAELRLNLVTILPSGIIGPGFQRSTPTIDIIEAARRGVFRLGAPRANFTFADVRDVAVAHVVAAERDAQGRFIVVDVQPSFRTLVRTLHGIDPAIGPPLLTLPSFAAPMLPLYDRITHRLLGAPRIATPEVIATAASGKVFNVSAARARAELGWTPSVSFEDSLRATLSALNGP